MSVEITPSLLTSSHTAAWQGASLEHYLYPAYETCEHTLTQHHLCIYLGKPLTYEQIVKGKLRSHNCIYGDMVLYPAGLRQKLAWDNTAEIVQLDIDPQLLIQTSSSEKIELIPQYSLRDPLIQQLALTLLAKLQTGFSDRLYRDSLLQTLCLHLIEHYGTSKITVAEDKDVGLPPFLQRRLEEYIQANLARNITLSDMASVSNLSTSHLTRLFKQTKGISLYQYVIRCRIDRAKQLLKHEQLAIADIATRVGFSDQSHLTHHFKRQVGVTPKVFRQI